MSNKHKCILDDYLSILSRVGQYAYLDSIKDGLKLELSNRDFICRVLEYARIYLVADLAASYFYFNDAMKSLFERTLFKQFYQTYPDDFITDMKNAIKSHDTLLGDVCSFLAEELSQDPFEKLELLHFIGGNLTASLKMFAGIFQATKYKNGYFTINFKKLNKTK